MGRSASSGGSCDGNPAGWGSPEVVASLALGAALVVGFVLWELRACEPMLPLRFFRSRAFSSGNAGGLLPLRVAFGAVFFFVQFPADRARTRAPRGRVAAG